MFNLKVLLRISLLACITVSGCNQGSEGPPTVPVTGVVTLDGEAVSGALVLFHPVEKGKGIKTSSGETDATGTYSMQTLVKGNEYKDGLQPASYQVTLEKIDHSHRADNPLVPPKNLLPAQYRDPSASGFTVTVEESGENRFDFKLE